jgi:hypothetical protein
MSTQPIPAAAPAQLLIPLTILQNNLPRIDQCCLTTKGDLQTNAFCRFENGLDCRLHDPSLDLSGAHLLRNRIRLVNQRGLIPSCSPPPK